MKMWELIADALRESRRKKMFWVVMYVGVAVAVVLAPLQFREDGLYFFNSRLSENYELPASFHATSPQVPVSLTREQAVAALLLALQMLVLGWMGIVLWVSATAGMVPDFLRPGRVDLTLARPIGRWQVLVAKYLGALLFVAIQSGVFVLLTCLVVSLNSGRLQGGYLMVWPLVVHQFACLLPISLAIGLASRSTVMAILGTLGFSVFCFGTSTLAPHVREFGLSGTWAGNTLTALYVLLPKPQDVVLIAQQAMGLPADGRLDYPDPAMSLPTSLIVPAAALGWAVARFRKMDC